MIKRTKKRSNKTNSDRLLKDLERGKKNYFELKFTIESETNNLNLYDNYPNW